MNSLDDVANQSNRLWSAIRVRRAPLHEPHFHIRTLFQVNALDEAHLAGELSEDDRGSPRAFAEEADAFQQSAVGDAGGGEDELLAGGKVFRLVDTTLVFDA